MENQEAVTEIYREELKERRPRKKKRKKNFRMSGSVFVKAVAFFLLIGSFFAGGVLSLYLWAMAQEGLYTQNYYDYMAGMLGEESETVIQNLKECLNEGDLNGAKEVCERVNASAQLYFLYNGSEEEKIVWSTGEIDVNDVVVKRHISFPRFNSPVSLNGGHILEEYRLYRVNLYISFASEFQYDDYFGRIAEPARLTYIYRYELLAVAAGCVLLCLSCFVFLLCSAGHRNGYEEIMPGVLTRIYFDVFTLIFGSGVIAVLHIVYDIFRKLDMIQSILMIASTGTLLLIWGMFYLMDFAIRIKRGNCLKHTLIYAIWSLVGKAVCTAFVTAWRLLCKIPLVLKTVFAYLGICLLEMMGVGLFVERGEGVLLWILEKVILFPVVLYIALMCKKLLKGSKALAEGEENYSIDTSKMLGEFKQHGENLNSLGQGITKAVAERMKSEHLKTELITNVSHDLKTPLTSIINYADLICEEKSENPKIAEYAEVLLRQSGRLKKLLEDLVDASKATTGNVEVNMEPCEVGVLLSQAVGEYQQKMEEKCLELRVNHPYETVMIMADGRHLWRVFDNLFNNIYKYAQENSRVYLSVEEREEKVYIIFRNMSKYALDISPEELEERFVRGDKSRHMEGNGLGLSIAKSLVELQNGHLQIVTDGDLFKVVLVFDALKTMEE